MELILGLGSNQGDRLNYITQAMQALEAQVGTLTKQSSIYETEPWGFETEVLFLNIVASFNTTLSAEDILTRCHSIETDLGRTRSTLHRYMSRTIDIDILFYGNNIINTSDLTIPHPLIVYRNFVLDPLKEMIPEFIHPVLQCRIKDLKIKTLPKHR